MKAAAFLALLQVAVAVGAVVGEDGQERVHPAQALPWEAAQASTGPLDSADEVHLAFVPGNSYAFSLESRGDPVTLVVRLRDGASFGGVLHSPCRDVAFSTNVIALSTSGQSVARATCPLLAGEHRFTVDAGESAFLGSVQLVNATFRPS